MEKPVTIPFYLKISQILIGIVAFFFILYVGSEIIVPLLFALILAILLNPLVEFLQRKKFNRVLSIFITVLLAFIFISTLVYFIFSQASLFSDAFPQLKIKFNLFIEQIIHWFSQTFNVSHKKINVWISKQTSDGLNNTSTVISSTLTTIGGLAVTLFLIPVYIFMFLFYKNLFLKFISCLFPTDQHAMVKDVLAETKTLVQNYLLGLSLEAVIVAALNSAGLLILGIDYAILLGVIGALLNVIPYIGGLIAISLPMIIAVATKSSTAALWVFIVYTTVQFIDNNYIVPYVVASKVKINALISIVVVLIGGALWGVPGMFLSIPLTAIIKVIFDRIEPLKPWGILLGDDIDARDKNLLSFIKRKPAKKIDLL
jgi:predicted PurR-regulated permease PerM